MSTTQSETPRAEQRRFLGHPMPLATLFGMEVWERFSFYGMQAILLIYLYYATTRGGLAIDQSVAIGIVGAYGSAVYLATIAGGWFADRVFGAERTLFYAGVIVMLGHISLAAIPGTYGLTIGLVCIALGSGGVKSTCASLVGTLYEPGDTRRDAGFSIFYLGINLGGFFGPLLTGILQKGVGFHIGFGLAAIGMAIGLLQYSIGRKKLPDHNKPAPSPLAPGAAKGYAMGAIAVLAVVVLGIVTDFIRADNLASILLTLIAILAFTYFYLILKSKRVTRQERKHTYAFIPLFLVSAAYWALYSQTYTVITAFFDQRVDRVVFGWEIPVGWLVSMQALLIITLSGIFAWLWTVLGKRQPSSAGKFTIAMFIIGLTFLGFMPYVGGGAASMPLIVLVIILFGFSVSEMCLSPIGLSVATKLAPAAFQTQMMSLFYLSLALGFAVGGYMGTFYSQANETSYFIAMTIIGVAAAVLLLACLPFIKRNTQGVD